MNKQQTTNDSYFKSHSSFHVSILRLGSVAAFFAAVFFAGVAPIFPSLFFFVNDVCVPVGYS